TARPTSTARGTVGEAIFARLRGQVEERVRQFEQAPPTPAAAYTLEKELRACLDEAGRALLEETFNRLEPAERSQAVPKVRYHRQTYRINKRTPAAVATAFGPITLRSWLYLA